MADSWIKVADERALDEGRTLAVFPRGLGVLLAKVDGAVYAVADRCAHMACPLGAGRFDRYILTCPCHDWRFDVRTGAFVDAPEIAIATYPVRIAGGDVLIELNEDAT